MFWFVLRKAGSVNHYISILSPDYHCLLFLPTTYYSLVSQVYNKDQYLFPEGGRELFNPQVERGGVSFMPALPKTVFLKPGAGADVCQVAAQCR